MNTDKGRLGGMGLSFLAFLGLAFSPRWHEEWVNGSYVDIKAMPSRPRLRACASTLGLSSLFHLVSALWQHVAAASAASIISSTTQGYVGASVGSIAVALAWLSGVLALLAFIGVMLTIASIRMLDHLTDD